jgi:hypothetical protein
MPQTRRAKQAGSAALDRLLASIEAAETALKELPGEVRRDSRDLFKDIGKTLKTARRNVIRSRRRIVKDLEQIEKALVKGRAARPAPKRATSAPSASAARSSKAARTKRATKRTATKRTATKRTAKVAKVS